MPMYAFEGLAPQVHEDAFVAPTATLVGDVIIEAGASVWYGAVVRADYAPVIVRTGANVQDKYTRSNDGFFANVQPRLDAIEEVTVTSATAGADASGTGAVQIRFVTRSRRWRCTPPRAGFLSFWPRCRRRSRPPRRRHWCRR